MALNVYVGSLKTSFNITYSGESSQLEFKANSYIWSYFRAIFPCGDNMVCIIDDREDVWNFAANLIRVKPYQFFKGVGDINAPLGGSAPVTEDTNPFGNPGNRSETTTDDAKIEESNSRDDNEGGVTEQKKNDAACDDNGETERKVANPETKEIQKLDEDMQISSDSSEPVIEDIEQNKSEKITGEVVEEKGASSKVVENGGGDSASNKIVREESTEIQKSSVNTRNGKQDADGKAENELEQRPSEGSVSPSSKTELKGEGGECQVFVEISCNQILRRVAFLDLLEFTDKINESLWIRCEKVLSRSFILVIYLSVSLATL